MTKPLPPSNLLDGRTVSRRLKLRAGTLDELVQSGKVDTFDGGLYDLEQVRRVAHANETTLETTVSEDARTHALTLASTLADKAMSREGRMFELYAKNLSELVEALQAENKALRLEIGERRQENRDLHERLIEGAKLRESLLSEQHERDLLTRMTEARSNTQREALELVKRAVPLVRQHFRAAVGNSVAKQLFDSIEDSQLEAILAIDFLNDEQKALLRKLTDARTNGAPDAPQPNGTEKPS